MLVNTKFTAEAKERFHLNSHEIPHITHGHVRSCLLHEAIVLRLVDAGGSIGAARARLAARIQRGRALQQPQGRLPASHVVQVPAGVRKRQRVLTAWVKAGGQRQ